MSRQSVGDVSSQDLKPWESPRTVEQSREEYVDRHPWVSFAALSVLYFATVAALSSMKLLWLDELITLHIAKLDGAGAIWNALARGADPNPPLTHLLVHYCRAIFGDHEFVYRLPAAAGYWIGMVSLFEYMRRRVPATWALGATVLSMTMAAFDYSYESRSYGIFYGLAMLAFLLWTRAVEEGRSPRTQTLCLAGMTLTLAAGISTNYFAVLAFVPIAAGEAARSFLRWLGGRPDSHERMAVQFAAVTRVVDWRIWIAMAIAASPLIVYRPLIEHSIAQFAPYAWNKVSWGQVSDSYTEMVEVVLYPILGLFLLAILMRGASWWIAALCAGCRAKLVPRGLQKLALSIHWRFPIPLHEAVGVFCFMAYPVVGYTIASIRGGMLSPRFVIPVCFGFAIAATLVAFQLAGNVRRAGVVFLCFVTAWFVCRESVVGYWYEEQKQCFYKLVDRIPQAEAALPASAPIVVPDPLLALTFQHYAPRAITSRQVLPLDFPAIRRFRHDDSPEQNLWAGRDFLYSLKIVPLAEFQNAEDDYLIVASNDNWYVDDLRSHHYPVQELPIITRATQMGGFTPLARGTPVFFTASWETSIEDSSSQTASPIPFRSSEELPAGEIANGVTP